MHISLFIIRYREIEDYFFLVEILNDFIGADRVLDNQKNGSSENNFYRIFNKIFSTDKHLVILFFAIMFTILFIFFNGGYQKVSHADTDTTTITENITTTKKETTTIKEKETTTEIETTTERNVPTLAVEEAQTRAPEKEPKEEVNTSSDFGRFKSYTDYRCLSRSSPQWRLQEQAHTDENGLRKIGDAYLVAMGSYYGTTLGTKYTVTLSNGNSFTVMLCDGKADRHTDANNQICLSNGSVIEFYVESDKMPSIIRQMGSVGALEQFSGSIASIEKVA